MKLTRSDIRAMRSDQFLWKEPWNHNPEANLRMCEFRLRHMFDEPIHIVVKSRLALFPKFATNLSTKRLWVQRDFHSRPASLKSALEGHELVHFEQRKAYGDWKFNRLYLFRANHRLRFEVPAYREGIRIHRAHGATHDELRAHVDRLVRSLRRKYLTNIRRRRSVEIEVRNALLMEIQ